MNLTDEQRQRVTAWILQGAKLSEVQNRLVAEFGIKLTYMEARFLVDDLKLTPKDPEPPKVAEPARLVQIPFGGLAVAEIHLAADDGTRLGDLIHDHGNAGRRQRSRRRGIFFNRELGRMCGRR